jgi:hypothetical protein
MTEQLMSSIVRILDEKDAVVGAGFLVSKRQVLTCAHVVAQALGLSEDAPGMPTAGIRLDFPLVAPEHILRGRIILWQPETDIAGLELDDDPPAGAQPVHLVRAKDLWGHAFRAFGFPAGYDDGVWASGVLRGRTGAGWVQIEDVKTPGYWVQPGFSGGPVWDEQLAGVAGMVTAAETQPGVKAAFIIPNQILVQTWPELTVYEPLPKLSNVPPLPPHYLPRDDELAALKVTILGGVADPVAVTGRTQAAGVQGMGGIGKSVLAAALARDEEVRRAFPDGVFWVTVGREPALTLRQSQLAEALGDPLRAFEDVQQGKARLSELLADKACLLILDDVWNAKHAGAFDALGPHCRMLLTTRDAAIIVALGATEHRLDVLSDEQALGLLADWAGQDVEALPAGAHEVAQECGNLPLALAMVGAMVRGKPDRWGNALHRLRSADLEEIQQQFPSYPYPNLLRAIRVSVEALAPEVQARYLDLAVFPEDTPVPEAALQTFWAPEGLDAYDAQDVVDTLVDRSLARRDETGRLSLHDLQYDYVRKQVEGLPALHDRLLRAYAVCCPDGWPNGPDDGYFFQQLGYHLVESSRGEELQQLLLDPNWFQAQQAQNPSMPTYFQDIRRVLEGAAAQGVNGFPSVIAFGLLRGTIVTRGYELTSEQLKQMIDTRQVDAILEWADRFPDEDWFKVDLIQAAGETAALSGQQEEAIRQFRRAARQVKSIPGLMMSQHLRLLANDMVMQEDEEGIALLSSIAEQIPDHFINAKSETMAFLNRVQEFLKHKEVDLRQRSSELGFEQNPVIKRVTSESYTKRPSEDFLYAAEESAQAWARFAEVLEKCGDRYRARRAFAEAQRASGLIGQVEHQDDKSRVLGRLAEVAKALNQPESEVRRLLDEAIATAEKSPFYISRIYAQVFLANLSVKLGYPKRAVQVFDGIFRQFQVERPMMIHRTIWLSQLAPCAELLSEPSAVLADWIEDESVRKVVDQTWRAYLGDVEAAKALLVAMNSIEDVGEANPYILRGSLNAMIPLLRMQPQQPRDGLSLEQVLLVSCRVLPVEFWLDWLGRLLPKVKVDENTALELVQAFVTVYSKAPGNSRVNLALRITTPLAYLPTLDRTWEVSLIHSVFCQERLYHRSFVLGAIERFVPLVLKLGGTEAIVETWDRIQAVEQLFERDAEPSIVGEVSFADLD